MSQNIVDAKPPIEVAPHSSLEGSASSDCQKVEEISANKSEPERGGKRKRDIDDGGGTSNSKSADYIELEDWVDMDTSGHWCWIKESSDYRAQQIKLLREKYDASELISFMNDNMINLTKNDIVCYYKWWLTTATRCNHVSLVSLMLAGTENPDLNKEVYLQSYATHDDDLCQFGRPFYIAITNGFGSLVQAFLLAGETVTGPLDRSRQVHRRARHDRLLLSDISSQEHLHEKMSAVEIACIFNQPEVLELLANHFNTEQLPAKDANATWDISERTTSPLHLVMKLATDFYGPHLTHLPSYVRLIINAGGDVNPSGFTPLQFLLLHTRLLTPLNEYGDIYRTTIIEIMNILLKAGTNTNTVNEENKDQFHPLMSLTNLLFAVNDAEMKKESANHISVGFLFCKHLKFVNHLARRLLVHGADVKQFPFHKHIPVVAENILMCRNKWGLAREMMMDSLCELLRSALLAGACLLTAEDCTPFLVNPFVNIANYALHPCSHSAKLLNMILNASSECHKNKLMNVLKKRRESFTGLVCSTHSCTNCSQLLCEQLDNAMNFLENEVRVANRGSLQDLARHAIIGAMSLESRLLATSEDLCLPPKLGRFVLLQ